jgi:butyrate kinase
VVVDEMIPEARISGFPGIERRSIFHALNQKSVARQTAAKMNRNYEDINLIVAHMGGGISVGAHRKGRIIDVNNALDGEGPFSPERSGTVPAGQLLDRIDAGVPVMELRQGLTGKGGMEALFGSKDHISMMEAIDSGDEKALLIHNAMVLQIAREICSHGATLEGEVDGIVLTGGLAKSSRLIDDLKRKISFLAEVIVIPGEREMYSLAENALSALIGEQEIKEY